MPERLRRERRILNHYSVTPTVPKFFGAVGASATSIAPIVSLKPRNGTRNYEVISGGGTTPRKPKSFSQSENSQAAVVIGPIEVAFTAWPDLIPSRTQ